MSAVLLRWFAASDRRFSTEVFYIIERLRCLISVSSLPTFWARGPCIVHERRRAVAKWIGVHSELRANAVEDPKFLSLGVLTSCVCGMGSV